MPWTKKDALAIRALCRTMQVTMTLPSRRHTQWAAQFAVASELCKRGYDVAFTAGNNTPAADLFVRSPTGHPFMVEVKGLRGRNFWLVKDTVETLNSQELYYVLAYVPPEGGNEFFVLNHREMIKRVGEWKQRAKWPSRSFPVPGINWGTARQYKDHWHVLPK